MSSVKQWLEDARAGGFDSAVLEEHLADIKDRGFITIHTVGWIFLVADAWQAVGKTRGWGKGWLGAEDWKTNWSLFIDALADGKDIEEALKSIE